MIATNPDACDVLEAVKQFPPADKETQYLTVLNFISEHNRKGNCLTGSTLP